MIDEGEAQERTGEVPFARTYDYFKHMTGIALISIGGVFAFLDADGSKLDPRRSIIVLAALGLSGVTSLLMASFLAGLEVKPVAHEKLVRRVRLGGFAATFFLAMGLGGFIQTFASAMLQ